MARRNGRGSKSLAETIAQFERSELKLLRSASKAQILTSREAARLEERFADSPSQKRSSDILSAAIHLNKLLAGALREAPNGERSGPRAELEVLAEMAAALRVESRPDAALLAFLQLLSELVTFDRAAVFVFDSRQKHLEPIAAIGGGVDLIQRVEFELGTGFSSWVAKRRKATLLTDLQRPAPDGETPLRCFMSVPVIVHGDLVGVLNLGHTQPRAFDEDHLRLVSTVASLLGATLTREVAERLLAENAAIDARTGVLTQKVFAGRVLEETDRSRRHGDPLTFVLVRVEDHAAFVETQGLGTAEAILRDLARVLRSSVRTIDPLAQVGPGEFALLLVHTTVIEARAVVGRLLDAVAKHSFPRRKRIKIATAFAAFPESGEEFAELIATARRRLGATASPPATSVHEKPADKPAESPPTGNGTRKAAKAQTGGGKSPSPESPSPPAANPAPPPAPPPG